MSMPGAYRSGSAARRARAVSEDEVYRSVAAPGEADLYRDDEADVPIEDDGEDDEDEDDEDDEDYLEVEEFDEEDIEFEQGLFDDDDDENTELEEAERLASAAEVAGEADAPEESTERATEGTRYTLTVDPVTRNIYIVDSNGNRQELSSGGQTEQTNANTTGGQRRTAANTTLGVLQRLLGRGRFRRMTELDGEDSDDDDPYYGGGRSAAALFPKVLRPVKEGVELERNGLFGRPGLKYDSRPRRKFSNHYTNINDTLRDREYRTSANPGSRLDIGDNVVPNSPGVEVALYGSRVYCGQYSNDGSFFYTCAQDYRIRIYDMTQRSPNKSIVDPTSDQTAASRRSRAYRMRTDEDQTTLHLTRAVQAREHLSSWTITDANLSPDNSKMIWSTIGPVVGMTKFKDTSNDMDILDDGDGDDQVALDFGTGGAGRRHFGIWSIRFSADGREIVAGAGSGLIHVYDLESRRTILSINAHHEDVNAVCFADTASSNVLVSGSDDSFVKVWDRRSLGELGRFTKPSGVLVGHTEGITFVAPKGDGRFVLSNGKDQTCKLWDLRNMYSSDEFSALDRLDVSVPDFDYRYGLYKRPRFMKHPHDRSVMTYTGHTVLQTLIRCHFSPESTTGQRYVYSGSYDGRIHIWNLDGTVAQVLDRKKTMPLSMQGESSGRVRLNNPSEPDRRPGTYPTNSHSPIIRDVSWAPHAPAILSSAWTELGGSVAMHEWKGFGKRPGAEMSDF